jgi:hypothetical protein
MYIQSQKRLERKSQTQELERNGVKNKKIDYLNLERELRRVKKQKLK